MDKASHFLDLSYYQQIHEELIHLTNPFWLNFCPKKGARAKAVHTNLFFFFLNNSSEVVSKHL